LALGAGQVFDRIDPAGGTLAFDAVWIGLTVAVALIAWLVSSILVGRQRRILPGIVLSAIFAASLSAVLVYLYTQLTLQLNGGESFEPVFDALAGINEPTRDAFGSALAELPWIVRIWPVGVGLIVSAVIWVYYVRFRLPFAAGLLGVALVSTGFAVFAVVEPYLAFIWNPTASLITGLVLFLAGVVFDARDPQRTTRLSGAGFWLHFFAAPILLSAALSIVNLGFVIDVEELQSAAAGGPLVEAIAGNEIDAVRSAIATLIVIGVFALVSLLINRRALDRRGLDQRGHRLGRAGQSAGPRRSRRDGDHLVAAGRRRGAAGRGLEPDPASVARALPKRGADGASLPARQAARKARAPSAVFAPAH
jgi:hypothetical protein